MVKDPRVEVSAPRAVRVPSRKVASPEAPASRSAGDVTASGDHGDAPRLLNGRYVPIRRLGQGGMGTVYLVIDCDRQDLPMALKRVRRDQLDSRTLALLRNEFLTLARLRHPNLARVYDFGVENLSGDLFFTSEFVDGEDWSRATGGLDLARDNDVEVFLDLAVQVLRALEFIHSSGLVHGDVKPGNTLVSREPGRPPGGTSEPSRLVKMIDFGLTVEERAFGGKKIAGTPYYVAPETILGSRVDRRTDLYSLGAVLYHLATGSPPFQGDSNLEILKAHVESPVPSPREVSAKVPPELSDIILRLLEKEAPGRFQSALEVVKAINDAFGSHFALETPATRTAYLRGARLVGREREQKQLESLLGLLGVEGYGSNLLPDGLELLPDPALLVDDETVPQRSERFVLLEGEPGLGMRWLLDELHYVLQAHQIRIVTVDCTVATQGESPLRELLRELAALPELQEAVDRCGPLLPGGSHPSTGGSTDQATDPRVQLFSDLSVGLLSESRQRPIALHFEELARADDLLVDFLRILLQDVAADRVPANRLVVTASTVDARRDGQSPFYRLRESSLFKRESRQLRLERLDRETVERLISTAFPGLAVESALAELVLEESDGIAEVALDILRVLLEREKITRTPSGWRLEDAYDTEPVPGRVRTDLKKRLCALPEEALRLATMLALWSRPCEAHLAGSLGDLSPRAIEAAVKTLSEANLLTETIEQYRRLYSLRSATVRTILYQLIPAQQRRWYHERAAALFEEYCANAKKKCPSELAYQFLKAGNRPKAVEYGLETARLLSKDEVPEEAIETYESIQGLCSADGDTEDVMGDVRSELATLRFDVGDYRGVLDLLVPSGSRSGSEVRNRRGVQTALQVARAHIRLANFEEAARFLDTLHRRVGPSRDQLGEEAVRFAAEVARAELAFAGGNPVDSLRRLTLLGALASEQTDKRLVVEFHLLAAESQFLLGDRENAAGTCQLAVRLLQSEHGNASAALGLFARGVYYRYLRRYAPALRQLREALVLFQRLSSMDRQGDCLLELGRVYADLGLTSHARSALLEAARRYEKTGNRSRLATTRALLGEVHGLLGETEACLDALSRADRDARDLGDPSLPAGLLLSRAFHALDRGDLLNAARYLTEAKARPVGRPPGLVDRLRRRELESRLAHRQGRFGAALDAAADGQRAARELDDPVFVSRFLSERVSLLIELGAIAESRREIVNLLDISTRYGLRVGEGWARLAEATILCLQDRVEKAETTLGHAAEHLMEHGTERDRVRLYLEHGMLSLIRNDHEQAYLDFEEGRYLARKLHLDYERCRYWLAGGLFELATGRGQSERAQAVFQKAVHAAVRAPYPILLWQAQYHLGRVLVARKDAGGMEYLRAATSGLHGILSHIPGHLRRGYMKARPASDLLALATKVSREPQVEKVV